MPAPLSPTGVAEQPREGADVDRLLEQPIVAEQPREGAEVALHPDDPGVRQRLPHPRHSAAAIGGYDRDLREHRIGVGADALSFVGPLRY